MDQVMFQIWPLYLKEVIDSDTDSDSMDGGEDSSGSEEDEKPGPKDFLDSILQLPDPGLSMGKGKVSSWRWEHASDDTEYQQTVL